MLTPADINTVRFSTTRLKEGYDQEEVDDFLDRAAAALAATENARLAAEGEMSRLRAELRSLRDRPTAELPAVPPSPTAESILRLAQETADRAIADATGEADRIVREAGGKGARIIDEATAAAEKIRNEGYAEKAARLAELEEKQTKITNSITVLNDRGRDLRETLNQALAAFDRGLSSG